MNFIDFLTEIYNDHKHLLNFIWEDPMFPWDDDMEQMSQYVSYNYNSKESIEFEHICDLFTDIVLEEAEDMIDNVSNETDNENYTESAEDWYDEKNHNQYVNAHPYV